MTDKNLSNRQKQAISTKKKIFDTTARLIEEFPFEKITIRMLCKEAGVSVGTFYLYFKSKQHILSEMYREADKVFMEIDITSRKDLNSLEKIKELIRIKVIQALNIDIKILREIYASYIYFDSEYLFSEDGYFLKALNTIVVDGQRNKEIIEDIPSEEVARKIYKLVRGEAFDWLVQDGGHDLEKAITEEISFYLRLFSTFKGDSADRKE